MVSVAEEMNVEILREISCEKASRNGKWGSNILTLIESLIIFELILIHGKMLKTYESCFKR